MKMIKKFQKDFGQNYYNIFQLIYLFIVSETIEIMTYLGIYNPSQETYNYRRTFWLLVSALFGCSILLLFVSSTSLYILNSFHLI